MKPFGLWSMTYHEQEFHGTPDQRDILWMMLHKYIHYISVMMDLFRKSQKTLVSLRLSFPGIILSPGSSHSPDYFLEAAQLGILYPLQFGLVFGELRLEGCQCFFEDVLRLVRPVRSQTSQSRCLAEISWMAAHPSARPSLAYHEMKAFGSPRSVISSSAES